MKEAFYKLSVAESLSKLGSQINGLSEQEVARRLQRDGKNQLKKTRQFLALKVLLNQFKSLLIAILFLAMGLSIFLGEKIDAIAIFVVIALNTILGFIEEYKAEKSIDSLKNLETLQALVVRDGVEKLIDPAFLVKGDVLILNEGEKIPADCRILEAFSLEVDESMLTGESAVIVKSTEKIDYETSIADRKNLLYSSCLITKGKAKVVVIATGMATQIGQIATQIQAVKEEQTPLQKTLDHLGKNVALLAMVLATPILLIALWRGEDLFATIMMGVSLAVSSIPEGLPIVVTVALALGIKRMMSVNVLTKKLPAVESLGGVDVICSDKTGTITKNQMEVMDIFMIHSSASDLALEAVLCSDAKLDHGDPTERALVDFLQKYPDQEKLLNTYQRTAELPFSSENKYMAVIVTNKQQTKTIIKGAPEIVLQFCKLDSQLREKILKANEDFTKKGLRVLAVIAKNTKDASDFSELKNFNFAGLLALQDPPREQVKSSILKCKSAGVRVIMITGDHKNTALSIAKEIGLEADMAYTGQELDQLNQTELIEAVKTCQVFARVSPQNKVQILEALQSQGLQVAMTGDGVNDAPALKKADIGIVVGSGTALSKDIADMILLSDDFSNIVDGIEEGRHIFFNIKKFVRFLLSANFDEILCIASSILFSLPLVFIPIQILWLNLVTDTFPALALSNDNADQSLMKQKPYTAKKEVVRGVISYAAVAGFFGYMITFSTFLFALFVMNVDEVYARTMSFSAMIFFELFLVFSIRSEESALRSNPFSNKFLNFAVLFAFTLQFLAIYHPFLQNFLKTTSLKLVDLVWLLLWSSCGFVFMEVYKKIRKDRVRL